ncbi:YcnI family copper-binding membrane protein [Gandjariella thermophila]|uniref:YncI copper-binding domain-containing protein n=1 Tax=Gandjariella thermophila TaxID=1931992 RepID=A0A4D4JCR5_9PSEU|nr:YcnI family protein [Gandjariella thermophila]GDY33172.1 hypothetical protein GTS_48050 [Gandjariella thermophila]
MSQRFLPSRVPAGRRLVGAVIGVAGAFLLQPLAWAHVTVNPNTAVPGGYAKESFRVPNERDDASTVQVEVVFPTDHPLPSVSVADVPGWTSTVQKQKLPAPVKTDDGEVTEAVTSVIWRGGAVEPGHFQEFSVSVGPIPEDTDRLVFKALQTYSDGSVVRWIDVPQGGGPEPEHPAPVLEVHAPAAPPAPPAQPDVLARTLGGAGMLAGLGALAWVVLGGSRAPRPPRTKPEPHAGKVKVRT